MASSFHDITANLKSLSFDAGLTEEESELLFVQKRSHAVRTCMVGQACYLAAIIIEGKRLIFEHQQKGSEKKTIPWKEISERKPLRIGILGCGALGKSLVRNLQNFADVHPEEILISTRRPELLTEFAEAGIKCFYNNKKLVKLTDITFICCLPSHFDDVLKEIKGHVMCLLYSFVIGYPRSKICKWLNFYDVIKPEFILGNKEKTTKSDWNYKQSISSALETESTCEVTCPGSSNEDDIVTTHWKLAELMVYIFVNMCIVQGLPPPVISNIVSSVLFGMANSDESLAVTEEDLWNYESRKTLLSISLNETTYEIFSLDKLHFTKTKIASILRDQSNFAGSKFRKRYVKLFDRRKSWRTECQLVES